MSFPRYERYKDSGIDWLGEVPAHWRVDKFRHFFTESSEKIVDEPVGVMLSVSGYRGIEVKLYEDENQRRLDEDLVNYRIVRPGQLVINSMWMNFCGLGVSEFEGHVSPAYRAYWIGEGLNKRFVHHLLRSERFVLGYTKYLTGVRPNSLQMGRDDLMGFPVLVPPTAEQELIAAFLDHETAKIDALIDEQQRLIALLKEKRQAVISHAVTKGLDQTVRRKNSAGAWMGGIPEHWQVRKLKGLISTRKGVAFSAESFTDAGTGVVKASDIKDLTINEPNTWLPAEFATLYPRAVLKPGELILSTVGSAPHVRNSAVGQIGRVPVVLAGTLLNQNTVVFTPSTSALSNDFLLLILQTREYRDHLDLHSHGTANQASLNVSDMLEFLIALPSFAEQCEITKCVNKQLHCLDDLASFGESAIVLLQERRAALISAAVTGKIDVRNYAPRETSPAPEELYEPA